MKRTKFRRLLPVFMTLLTVIVLAIGITATANEADPRSNQITHANLVLDNDVDLVFWADVSESDAQNKSTYMVFNDEVTVHVSQMQTLDGVTYATFVYPNIMPKDLVDVVNAKLYVNGVYTSYIDYSVKDYCQYILTNSTSASLKTLVSDLLVYGAESQAVANESADTFVTNGITGLTPSASHDSFTVLHDTKVENDLSRGPSAALSGYKITMQNGLELHFDVDLPEDADPSEYMVCLIVNGREQELPIMSKMTLSGYSTSVTFKGIYSYELFDQLEINIYKQSVRVSETMTFSVASFVNALNKVPEYNALTNAFYNYCYSAHVYAGTHTVGMPGALSANGQSNINAGWDDTGKIAYKCSLCGQEVQSLSATHVRDFSVEVPYTSTVNGNYSGRYFTTATLTETKDGAENKYLSMTYDETTNIDGSLGYYFSSDTVTTAISKDIVNDHGMFNGSKFTFSFGIKAPGNGLAQLNLNLRSKDNTDTSITPTYAELLTINPDGSITRGTTKIAPHSTITSAKWTVITVTMDFYADKNGVPCIFLEYYADNTLLNAFSITNPLLDGTFSDVYFSMDNRSAENGQGVLFDDMVLAQGLVHSFTDDVLTHLSKLESGNLRKLIDMVQNDFNAEQFSYVVRWDGKSENTYKEYQGIVTLPRDKYMDPEQTPKSYDHPRVLFNSNDVPQILANIEDEKNALAKAALMKLVGSSTDGKLTPTTSFAPSSFEWTNYNTTVLRTIEAKAFYYAIYKDSGIVSADEARLRGYEAIYAMKNYLLTFDVQWKASDQCRYYGEMMYYSALVYDWCYDLLTESDKEQFILGVQNLACDGTNNMPWAKRDNAGNINSNANGVALNTHEARKLEGGFPALAKENQGRLTGHGAEAQVLRDYFSFAIAIYDEESSWYDYVGGLIYQDYVDARNYFYTSGFYPDGSAGYAQYRFLCDMYNAWLFKGMGVELPYNEEDMATVIHGLMAMETVDGYQFATADGAGKSSYGQYRIPDNAGDAALISSYLFDDSAALAAAHYVLDYRWGRGSFSSSQLCTSAAYYLILTSNGLTPAADYQEKIQNVEYHGGFQQQIVTRNSGSDDENSVVVLMQGAQHLPGGHTHQNAGNFQIWYKGMLTRDDGLYDAYGSDHHHYYHMAAVAHNTLLIYNPKRANNGTEPVGRVGFYNGGQRCFLSVPNTYKQWIDDERFSYGKLIGWETDNEDDPSYVYFANDLTNAYEADTVDYVERSFMTVYTDDPETPMVMFIFDNITADSPNFQKTFLLQCATAPTIDYDNSTVTIDNGEGKLVLTSLLGNDSIKAYGRTSKNGVVYDESEFLVADSTGKNPGDKGYVTTYSSDYMSERFYLSGAGKNLLPGGATSIGDKDSDLSIVWGHVEIQPTANSATNQLMNVLYVADSGTNVSATPLLIEGNNLTGATFKNYTSVFLTDSIYAADPMSFTATAEAGVETMTYYVGGLADGKWNVFINDEPVYSGYDEEGNGLAFTVSEEGRMLTFTGEVGEVRIEPDESMRPQGSKSLAFNLNGGKWESGTEPESYYIPGETMILPVPVKKDSEFGGWFLDKNFSGDPITEIPKDATEALVLYAKWSSPIMYVDYTKGGSLSDHGGVVYSVEGGGGTTWDVVNDYPYSYFLWTNTGSGSILQKNAAFASYADQSLQISYSISLGRHGSASLMPLQLYLRDDANGRIYSNIFSTDSAGNVYIGLSGKVKIGEIASSGISTFRFVLDFSKGAIFAYDDDGKQIAKVNMSSIGMTVPLGRKSYEDWYRNMTSGSSSIFALKGIGAGTIRVYGLQMLTGNITENCKNFGPTSNMHQWDEGQLVGNPSETDCTPGSIVYTCLNEKCGATKYVSLPSTIAHQSLECGLTESGKVQYTCQSCSSTFTPGASYYLDGTKYGNIAGVGNASNFTTKEGTNLPVITSGSYDLINNTGNLGNIELWIPGRASTMSGFSSDSNALGFASFKINALTTNTIDFNFVDSSADATKWSSEWCITDSFFRVNAPQTIGGKTVVKITGWDGIVLDTIELQSDRSFTGWIDVMIYIELDADTDEIILHYYIGGQYKATVARELTTKTNAINSICITGSTSALGSGVKLDNIAFGYSANAAWEAPRE